MRANQRIPGTKPTASFMGDSLTASQCDRCRNPKRSSDLQDVPSCDPRSLRTWAKADASLRAWKTRNPESGHERPVLDSGGRSRSP
jgi:hypothetical protein